MNMKMDQRQNPVSPERQIREFLGWAKKNKQKFDLLVYGLKEVDERFQKEFALTVDDKPLTLNSSQEEQKVEFGKKYDVMMDAYRNVREAAHHWPNSEDEPKVLLEKSGHKGELEAVLDDANDSDGRTASDGFGYFLAHRDSDSKLVIKQMLLEKARQHIDGRSG